MRTITRVFARDSSGLEGDQSLIDANPYVPQTSSRTASSGAGAESRSTASIRSLA